MLSFDEARSRLLDEVRALPDERVDVRDAVDRVLAHDLIATRPQPPFNYSAMDGYAVRASDLESSAPDGWPVVGESRTGGEVPAAMAAGTTVRIFTGAMIPAGADAVVMQEDVDRAGDRVVIRKAVAAGANIRRAGEDLSAGTVALERGTRIRPHSIAMLASLDSARGNRARRPVVAILSTGDELREVGEPDRPGSVIDCNGPALAALVRQCGAIPRALPFARDDLAATEAALMNALDGADVVVTVGGVSVGDHDVVKPALAAAGIVLDFWKVAIKPGKPIAIGRCGAKYFIGLPGNPASALLTFSLFGAPLLRALQGDRSARPAALPLPLAHDVRHATGRLEFARAALRVVDGAVTVDVFRNQASGAITTFAWADGFAMLPADRSDLREGEVVSFLRMSDV